MNQDKTVRDYVTIIRKMKHLYSKLLVTVIDYRSSCTNIFVSITPVSVASLVLFIVLRWCPICLSGTLHHTRRVPQHAVNRRQTVVKLIWRDIMRMKKIKKIKETSKFPKVLAMTLNYACCAGTFKWNWKIRHNCILVIKFKNLNLFKSLYNIYIFF